ncbi:hypothetical protein SDC9_168324 [bioreactor metagenome]|uniref:Transcriptional regulator LacI/GalR-like sensor domain-containing protein n=1 Tax=bioreactor metagenome TaxID=1076179 RepID=A0A645G2U1_9ZZZZ
MRGAVEFGRKLFAGKVFPSAIICTDGRAAKGLLHAACEAGIKVPEQLSVFACSSRAESEQTFPPLSSIAWNAEEAIFRGIYMLKTLMGHRTLKEPNLTIDPLMTIRESTGRFNNR